MVRRLIMETMTMLVAAFVVIAAVVSNISIMK